MTYFSHKIDKTPTKTNKSILSTVKQVLNCTQRKKILPYISL